MLPDKTVCSGAWLHSAGLGRQRVAELPDCGQSWKVEDRAVSYGSEPEMLARKGCSLADEAATKGSEHALHGKDGICCCLWCAYAAVVNAGRCGLPAGYLEAAAHDGVARMSCEPDSGSKSSACMQ